MSEEPEVFRCDYCGCRMDRVGWYSCPQRHPRGSFFERAVRAIEMDLTDRGGLKNVWGDIDDETLDEIRDRWAEIMTEEMQK